MRDRTGNAAVTVEEWMNPSETMVRGSQRVSGETFGA